MELKLFKFFEAENGSGMIPCYVPSEANSGLLEVVKNNKDEIENQLLKCGGVVFKGFNFRSVSDFNKLVNAMSPNLYEYTNRSTPRSKLGGKIYTSTECPADRRIPFHNENAYTKKWPNKIFFYSALAATTGGETAIADARHVFKRIDPKIIEKFNNKKILYTRKYVSGIDLSWQETFQTDNPEDVQKYCQDNSITYEWVENSEKIKLITQQVCQATITHPITNEDVWFNQAHLFHISALPHSSKEALKEVLGEGTYTRNAYFGDGSEINLDELTHIREAYETERIQFTWEKGDVMVLDNRIMAHSRNPYTGDRKVVVAMGD